MGRSRTVSGERGAEPSQLCKNGATVEAAEDQSFTAASSAGSVQSVALAACCLLRTATKRLGASKPSAAVSRVAVATPEISSPPFWAR